MLLFVKLCVKDLGYPFYIMSDCNEEIISLIRLRMEKGRKEYGHGLIQNSGYDWVKEALEEALDLSVLSLIHI